jgi:dicarboxylate transporter 10
MLINPHIITINDKPAPPISQHIFKERTPESVIKDKSTHSEHGVIHYPFWYGGGASAVSSLITQPLGVSK